jgi:predicted DNA-binding transcriptional regulator YafY
MGMTKYDRLLYILNLLRSRKSLNAARLAEECGVAERSIYRDIITLSEANIPIYYDNGYKLASDNYLPPFNFTFEEYTCLRLALESTPLEATDKYREVLKQVLAKVEAGLSESTRLKKRTAIDPVRIDVAPMDTDAWRCYGDIERAISGQLCLNMTYETIEHGETQRQVEPYFMIYRRHAFYFVAYCRLRQDFRTFRLDRIRALDVTEVAFRRQPNITVDTYFQGSWRLYKGTPVAVRIRFIGKAARIVRSTTHHPDEIITSSTDDSDAVIYEVTVNGTREIRRWILGFGADAEVLEPESLREYMRETGRGIAGNHS